MNDEPIYVVITLQIFGFIKDLLKDAEFLKSLKEWSKNRGKNILRIQKLEIENAVLRERVRQYAKNGDEEAKTILAESLKSHGKL